MAGLPDWQTYDQHILSLPFSAITADNIAISDVTNRI
tara:strand:+ start:646 stop:756 length:111 start_codon:yes stop_codon:yes gene_type:complete